jgi:hypothetical protein
MISVVHVSRRDFPTYIACCEFLTTILFVQNLTNLLLRDHLRRKHTRKDGKIRCVRCQGLFSSGELKPHMTSQEACKPMSFPADFRQGLDDHQMVKLKSPTMKRKKFGSESRRWEEIFSVIFPDWNEDIPSPCRKPLLVLRLRNAVHCAC